MRLSEYVDTVTAVLRRPADLLPLYALGAAIPAIVRVVPFLAVAVGYLHLATNDRLAAAEDELADVDTSPPPPDADEAVLEEWANQFVPVLEELLTPTIVVLAVGTVVVSLVGALALYAVVSAGQQTACYARLRDERGLLAGVGGASRFWTRVFWLLVLEIVLWLVVVIAAGIVAAILVAVLSVASTAVAALAGLALALATVAVLAAVRAVFAFAPVAVVVDDAGVRESLSRTVGFVRARPRGAVAYYVVALGALLALSTVTGLLVFVEVLVFPWLVAALVLFPALDLLKTALYSNYRGRLTPPAAPERSLRTQIADGLRRGWDELLAFVRARPGAHAAVVVLGVASFAAGWLALDPYAGTVYTSITTRLEGHVPPAAALEFFGNNWLVALTTAYGGVALAIPAVVSVIFNGVSIGITARLEVEPLELLAFVLPHGIFEIPAIFVAAVLGISLGRAWWRRLRGRTSRTAFADTLERAFWVLVGVGILLAVAAVIEGFVSPYYFRVFL